MRRIPQERRIRVDPKAGRPRERDRAKEPSKESLISDWGEKSALNKYALRVTRAAAQYRRERGSLSPVTWCGNEARAYAELQAEQQRAMRELVTGEYWRLVAVRDAPHQEPATTRQASGSP
jgi:hypothetical protein